MVLECSLIFCNLDEEQMTVIELLSWQDLSVTDYAFFGQTPHLLTSEP